MCSRWKFKWCIVVLLLYSKTVVAQNIRLAPENALINFEIKHLKVLTVQGSFDKFEGNFSKHDSVWVISGFIESESINTGNEERDKTLRTDAYLDVENYPSIRFEGTGTEFEKRIFVSGIITIKNLNAELKFDLLKKEGDFVSDKISISRKKLGLTFDSMDLLIGNEIKASLIIADPN